MAATTPPMIAGVLECDEEEMDEEAGEVEWGTVDEDAALALAEV